MFSLKKQKGFTIVELLIVIVVIGILATLVIVTFSGIQQKGRNSKRMTDINALQSHVEAYRANSGNYPSFAELTDSAWRGANMKGLDPSALTDPKGASITNSASTTATYAYGYVATHDDGTACVSTGTGTASVDDTQCSKFTLTSAQEGNTTIYTKQSN